MIMRVFLIFLSFISVAQAQIVTMDTDRESIDISTDFKGGKLTVFGERKSQSPLIITVEGPVRDMTVRKKNQVAGAWVNTDSVTFKNVPIFYSVAVSPNVERSSVQMENLLYQSADFREHNSKDQKKTDIFRNALIENKKKQDMYPSAVKQLQFYEGSNLFRVDFDIPPNVPVGEYLVRAHYMDVADDASWDQMSLEVKHVGTNAKIQKFAAQYSFIYALSIIFLAIFAGWLSNRIRGNR